MIGTWTNATGDVLTLTPVGVVEIHRVTGKIVSTANGPPSCASESYTSVQAQMSLRTADGRLDEATNVDLHDSTIGATFAVDLAPSALHGTLRTAPPFPLGKLHLEGTFQPATKWFVEEDIVAQPMPYENEPVSVTGMQITALTFDTRAGAASADGGP